ncbi:MAG: biotin--[acetyl-CoA-carboxylase] ligase [Candidatus Omnitrophica bacterium]|nr:biotin--[acetyl-CoA-carboxylase] ligase [Candidatus Omnitrophota bacterium]MDD5655186.1 biotin--[acetyl-CoA-carboxylase] ligase [Candidatus Omnitrophota bacterium]
MNEKILNLLRNSNDYVSGEEISHRLGVSRQAFWKHIQDLKGMGYDIEAVPHLGYRLVSLPDRLFASEIERGLDTKFMGRKIYYFDSSSSTNDIAMQLASKGAPEGTIILSESQTKGRGRLDRAWISPKYKGIYLSFILKPDILPKDAPILTLLAGVSACEALKEVCGVDSLIKWPNDILAQNKKIGGILTELSAETDEIHHIVVGIGLNVNNDKKSLLPSATSVRELKGENASRLKLLQELLRRLEENYLVFQKKGGAAAIEKWRRLSDTLGRHVRILSHKEHIEGQATDIDTDGGLLVRQGSGISRKVMSGDVVHCR